MVREGSIVQGCLSLVVERVEAHLVLEEDVHHHILTVVAGHMERSAAIGIHSIRLRRKRREGGGGGREGGGEGRGGEGEGGRRGGRGRGRGKEEGGGKRGKEGGGGRKRKRERERGRSICTTLAANWQSIPLDKPTT